MPSESSVGLFAPIIFLLVAELSNIARDIPLEEIVRENRPPITFREWSLFANLGRFPLIHFGNMVLLAFTVFVTLHFSKGIAAAGLLLGTSLLLYLLPLFELDEYDKILSEGEFPDSYWKHLQWISLILVLSVPGVLVMATLDNIGPDSLPIFYLVLVFTVAPFIATRRFVSMLQAELVEVDSVKEQKDESEDSRDTRVEKAYNQQ